MSRFKTTKCRKFNSIVLTSRSHELRQKKMVSVGKLPKCTFSHNLSTLEHKTLIFDSFDREGGKSQPRDWCHQIFFLFLLFQVWQEITDLHISASPKSRLLKRFLGLQREKKINKKSCLLPLGQHVKNL